MIMNRAVSGLMTKNLWTVNIEDTIEKVDEVINAHKLSAVPVLDAENGIFGIISSRDMLNFYEAKKNPKSVRAWELCSHKIISVSPQTTDVEVAELMVQNKIHHILVTESGTLQGMVSALDFVKQYVIDTRTER